MSLTLGGGPLASDAPSTVNYTIDAPSRALYMHPFPRRVRAEVGGLTVLDSDRGALLHESSLLPVLYVPVEDIGQRFLAPSEHTTHCPFKGDASYWDLVVGDLRVENAVWTYPEPTPEASWLRGMASMHWGAAEAWFDEEEQVHGHLRDPFHRVDARRLAMLVRISYGEQVIALSGAAMVLSETGLPNRYYVPFTDVHRDMLVPSRTRTYCPYKGRAAYWNLRVGDGEIADVGWSLPEPLKDGRDVRDHICFLHDELTMTLERD